MTTPKKFLRDTDKNGKLAVYWVLAEYGSKSNPSAKPHEVRTSKQDGKTYCTCRGWVVALNAGHSICTHIRQFKLGKENEPIVLMDFESFTKVKRGLSLITDDSSVEQVNKVRRA